MPLQESADKYQTWREGGNVDMALKPLLNEAGFSGVSVCVAACDSSAFIGRTLESILAQSYTNLRVIISDDASRDSTAEICERYANADPRVSVHRQTRRLGWVGNVNRALGYAEGEYLMIMSHDDEIAPDYVESLVAALERNPDAAAAFSDMVAVGTDRQPALRVFDGCDGLASPAQRAVQVVSRRGPWWVCYRSVVRMNAFRETGGLTRNLRGEFAADMPWVLRLAIAGELVRVPRVLYTKHRRPTSVSRSWSYGVLDWLAVLLSCWKAVAESRLSTAAAVPVYLAISRQMYDTVTLPARQGIRAAITRLMKRMRAAVISRMK